MSSPDSERSRLLRALSGELRRVGIVTVMFHQMMAEKLGLNATDSRAFSILADTGPIPAGRLAEHTGLSERVASSRLGKPGPNRPCLGGHR